MKHLILCLSLFVSVISANAQMPEVRDQYYQFAHRVLVAEFSKAEFVPTLERDKVAYLEELWKRAGARAKDGKTYPSTGLKFHIYPVTGHRKVVVVVLPEPKVISEAFMVGAIFDSGKPRGIVYTLEQGWRRVMMGGWAGSSHLNFGKGPEIDPEKFRDAILEKAKPATSSAGK